MVSLHIAAVTLEVLWYPYMSCSLRRDVMVSLHVAAVSLKALMVSLHIAVVSLDALWSPYI